MTRNHIILITGLFSSIPILGYVWTVWARMLQKRLTKHYAGRVDCGIRTGVIIHRVSADGRGEKKAFDAVRLDRKRGVLGKVAIVGHSNGFRDGLRGAELLHPLTEVCFFAGIDMTLGENGAEVFGNISNFIEFHGVLEYADLHKSFHPTPKNYSLRETERGHTASASLAWVQDIIFRGITSRI